MSKTLAANLRVAPSVGTGWDYIDSRKSDDPYRVHIIRGASHPSCGMAICLDEPRPMSVTQFLYHAARCTRCESIIRQTHRCTCFHDDIRPSAHHADYCDMRDDDMENPYNVGPLEIKETEL